MPVLTLPKSDILLTQQLVGVMLFPRSVRARRALQQSFLHERALSYLKGGHATVCDKVRYDDSCKRYVPSQEIIEKTGKESGRDPTLAGALLLLTLGTSQKVASLNLSVMAISKEYTCKFTGISKRKLETLWQEYRTVAHLWAAHQVWISAGAILDMEILPGFPCHPTQVRTFLGIAEYFRRKSEAFKLPRDRREGYLLDRNCTWKIRPAADVKMFSSEDFRFNSAYKMLLSVLEKRKIYGRNLLPNFAEEWDLNKT